MKARAASVYCKKQGIFLGWKLPVVPYRRRKPIENLFAPQQVMPHKEQFGSSMYEETSFGTPAEAHPAFGAVLEFSIQNGTTFVQLH